MTTPEPSPLEPLTDAELDALAKRRWSREKWHRLWQGFVKVSPDELKRLIAQARAARPSPWQDISTAPNDGNLVLLGIAGVRTYLGVVQPIMQATHWQPLPSPPAQDGGRP